MGIFNFFAADIAIDLGTVNTLIYEKGNGIVLNEPSIVAIDKYSKKIIAFGNKANEMQGREPEGISVIRPVIADYEIAEGMIKAFIKQIHLGVLSSRRVVIAVPSGVTEVEKRVVRDSVEHAGAKEVHLISEPMSAAIGIGVDVEGAKGTMIIDIGGGTTEIAIIALSGVVNEESIRIAGDEMNYTITQFFKRNHNLLIGERTAESIKCEVGSAAPLKKELTIQVKGRDLVGGIPKTIEVSSAEIRELLNASIVKIIKVIRQTLERTPPEISADIMNRGVMLTGGGALLKGLDDRIRMDTNLPVHVAEDPLTAVVMGTGKVIDDFNGFSNVLIRNRRY
jgi:rod shape-determining protein MreB